MITLRISTDVKDDRTVTLTLPPEAPTGRVELVITVAEPAAAGKRPRTSLADWAETSAENWGPRLNAADVEGFTGRRF